MTERTCGNCGGNCPVEIGDCNFWVPVGHEAPVNAAVDNATKKVNTPELVYLACPYSHSDPAVIAERVRNADIAAARLMEQGCTVFSPISHSHPISAHTQADPLDHDFWLRQDLPWLRKCDRLMVLMLPGWKESKGIQREMTEAERLGLPVGYMQPTGDLTATGKHVSAAGLKYDSGKPRYGLLPPLALLEVVKVLTFGAKKYDDENWRKLDNLQGRYFDASCRHKWAPVMGERNDPESGLHHWAHDICCMMFKLEDELMRGN